MLATRPARRAMAARNWVTPAACHATSSAITVPTHVAIAATWRAFVTRPAARGRTLTACTAWPSITASAIPSARPSFSEVLEPVSSAASTAHSECDTEPLTGHQPHARLQDLRQHVGIARDAQAQRVAEHDERLREHERHHPKSGEPPQRPVEGGDARGGERAKHEPAERETAEAEGVAEEVQRASHDREHKSGARDCSPVVRECRDGCRWPAHGEGEPPPLRLGVRRHDTPVHHVGPLLGRVHIHANAPSTRTRRPTLHTSSARRHDADAAPDRLHGLVEREADHRWRCRHHDPSDTPGGSGRGDPGAEVRRIGPDEAGVCECDARDGEHREHRRRERERSPCPAAQAPAASTTRAGTGRDAWPMRSTRPAAIRQTRPALMNVT